MSMANCKYVGSGAKCRSTDCPYYGMEHPEASKNRCKYASRQSGCRKKDCKFKHGINGFKYDTISATGDIMKKLLKKKGLVLNRVRKRCKALIQVSNYKQEICFRGTHEDIQKAKGTMYHELKNEGLDFLRLRNEMKDSDERENDRTRENLYDPDHLRMEGLQILKNAYLEKDENNQRREEIADLRKYLETPKRKHEDLKISLEFHSKNIEIEELKREEKYLKDVWKKCNDKNKQLKIEKEDIKREYNIKIETIQKMHKELISKFENLQSEKLKIEKNCSKLEIEVNSLKIKQEKKIVDTNVETIIREKELEYQALEEQLNERYNEMENELIRKRDEVQEKDVRIQGLEEKESEMGKTLKETLKENDQHQEESKTLRKNMKKIMIIRNRELKLYKDILGYTDTDSDEDQEGDKIERRKTFVKEEIRNQSSFDPFEDISESIHNVNIKEEIDAPEVGKLVNVDVPQVITLE